LGLRNFFFNQIEDCPWRFFNYLMPMIMWIVEAHYYYYFCFWKNKSTLDKGCSF
jgi:hypothetical protein